MKTPFSLGDAGNSGRTEKCAAITTAIQQHFLEECSRDRSSRHSSTRADTSPSDHAGKFRKTLDSLRTETSVSIGLIAGLTTTAQNGCALEVIISTPTAHPTAWNLGGQHDGGSPQI
jgi:hypothetical protein